MQTPADVAEFLRAERIRRRLSQATLARQSGLPLRTYQRLESGDPGARLASLLNVFAALGFRIDAIAVRRPTLDELDAIYGHGSDE